MAFIKSFAAHTKSHGVVILPSSYETLRLDYIEDLHRIEIDTAILALTPVEAYHTFHAATLAFAAVYELQRLAIPIHYQILRDRLQHEYGFAALSDRQFLQFLEESELLVSPQPSVFRSKARSKLNWPRDTIKRWTTLLGAGITDRVFDLPDFLRVLDRWYADIPIAKDSPSLPALGVTGWIEVPTAANVRTIYRLNGTQAVPHLNVNGDTDFLRRSCPSQLVDSHTQPIDKTLLTQIGKAATVRSNLFAANDDHTRSAVLLEYTRLWLDYISKQKTRGQEQKWRGWYLVPEHGPLTLDKLRELQRILKAMAPLNERGAANIDTSPGGIAQVVDLLKHGGVKYRRTYTARAKRNLFVRQQKNYLLRLGLVFEPSANELVLSALGRQWTQLPESELSSAFANVLGELRWSWCNMPFFTFLERLVVKTNGYVSYRELYNWVIHAYENSQLEEISTAVSHYRTLPESLRAQLNDRIDTTLRRQLSVHLSDHAFGHYRTKVKDLMVAFATTGNFRLVPTVGEFDTWRLLYRSMSQKDRAKPHAT